MPLQSADALCASINIHVYKAALKVTAGKACCSKAFFDIKELEKQTKVSAS
jgi:hypothetical protein